MLQTLAARVPARGVRRLSANDVTASLALEGESARRFTSLMQGAAIDSRGSLSLDLERPFAFASGDIGFELGTHVEARLAPQALQAIRGVKADGNALESAVRAVDPRRGPGIEVRARGFLGISGSRFLPL
jgi:hypothetical protein